MPSRISAPPSNDPFELCGTTIGDKYTISSVVGSGGFGVVYRGIHTGFDEPIAIKCLRLGAELAADEQRRLLSRLQEEGRVLHRLSKLTSGIVQALDVGAVTTPRGQWVPYLVLEWLEGETLAEHLHARAKQQGAKGMSLAEAIELLEPAANALAVAHQQKVAHRDVKPENLYLTEISGQRSLKVLDFGIAKVLQQHSKFTAAPDATQRAPTAFTPSYGAPEQFNKKRGATGPWTDVFALALILVEAVSGKRALEGDDATQLYIAAADPSSRPTLRHLGIEVSDAVEDVLHQALSIEPHDRYQDAGAFWDALREAAGHKLPPPDSVDVSETGDFVSRHEMDIPSTVKTAGSGGAVSAEQDDDQVSETATTVKSAAPDAGLRSPSSPAKASAGQRRRSLPRGLRPGRHDEDAPATPPPEHGSDYDDDTKPPSTTTEPPSSTSWMPVVGVLALVAAGLVFLKWRLDTPPLETDSTTMAGSVRRPTSKSGRRPHPSGTSSGRSPIYGDAGAAASAADAAAGAAAADASAQAAADGGADAAAEPRSDFRVPEDMVLITGPVDRETKKAYRFLIDRTEVTTKAYRECVMTGRCVKATRIVLTAEVAKSLGGLIDPDAGVAVSPEQLANAWGPRCNEVRDKPDHPVNCVNHAGAEDYCRWKQRRLPTSEEWTLAAAGTAQRQYPWGDEPPECRFACFGLNGSCLHSSEQTASCAVGSRLKDRSPEGVLDLAGNVSEWVADSVGQAGAHGPAHRVLRGGSFNDEADKLVASTQTSVPPVTAHVTIGFRCALDVPEDYQPGRPND